MSHSVRSAEGNEGILEQHQGNALTGEQEKKVRVGEKEGAQEEGWKKNEREKARDMQENQELKARGKKTRLLDA